MVAPTTPRLEYVPQVNLARAFLFKAADALDAGNWVQAGVLLREAVRRQLYAECAWHDCLPKKHCQRRSPHALLNALEQGGHCNECGSLWTRELIELGNKCAHCIKVKKPIPKFLFGSAPDDDDDDSGEEWKKGVQV